MVAATPRDVDCDSFKSCVDWPTQFYTFALSPCLRAGTDQRQAAPAGNYPASPAIPIPREAEKLTSYITLGLVSMKRP